MAGGSGETVLITGAASGMGACFARRFAAKGAAVACLDNSAQVLEVAAQLKAEGASAHAALADVSDPDAVATACEELEARLGSATKAVLAAGIKASATPIAELDPAEWNRVVAVNLTGVYVTMKTAIAQLRRSGGKSIVIVSSAAGLAAGPGYAAYYAAKHGTIGLLRTAANELAGEEIRVNAVCPGWVDTPMFDAEWEEMGWTREQAIAELAGDHLIKRLIEPDEIADAVLWLSSEQAAMLTGVALPIDGGLLAGAFTK